MPEEYENGIAGLYQKAYGKAGALAKKKPASKTSKETAWTYGGDKVDTPWLKKPAAKAKAGAAKAKGGKMKSTVKPAAKKTGKK